MELFYPSWPRYQSKLDHESRKIIIVISYWNEIILKIKYYDILISEYKTRNIMICNLPLQLETLILHLSELCPKLESMMSQHWKIISCMNNLTLSCTNQNFSFHLRHFISSAFSRDCVYKVISIGKKSDLSRFIYNIHEISIILYDIKQLILVHYILI